MPPGHAASLNVEKQSCSRQWRRLVRMLVINLRAILNLPGAQSVKRLTPFRKSCTFWMVLKESCFKGEHGGIA